VPIMGICARSLPMVVLDIVVAKSLIAD